MHAERMNRLMTQTDVVILAVIAGLIVVIGFVMWLAEKRQ
jgi:hypothetical protein